MRMPRVRFSVRGLMVVVAIAGLLSAGTKWVVIPDWLAYEIRRRYLPNLLNLALAVVVSLAIPLFVAALAPRSLRPRLLGPSWALAAVALLGWFSWTTQRSESFTARAGDHHRWSGLPRFFSLVDWRALLAHAAEVDKQSP